MNSLLRSIGVIIFMLINWHTLNAQSIGEIQMTDCFLEDCSFLEDFPNIEFGYLTVPENYDKPDGKLIRIAFAKIKSQDSDPEPDAVLYFQGGWGSPTLFGTRGFASTFPIKDRDVIIFDYRGIGYSEPNMCEWIGGEFYNDAVDNLSYEELLLKQNERLNKCLDSLEIRQIDFHQYGTNNKSRDAVLLTQNLGYESYNLFGISYGTRGIQDFLRLTDMNIRSVVLDSNCPIGYPMIGRMTTDYANSLNNIFTECSNDPDCNEKYPDLKQRFLQILLELDDNPLQLDIQGGETAYINKEELNAVLHQLLYNSYIYGNIPLLLESLINRDLQPITQIVQNMESRLKGNSSGLGLINYVYDWKVFQPEARDQYNESLVDFKDYELIDIYLGYFLDDTRFEVDSMNAIPVKSDVPALILAGTYDPITPPSFSQFLRPNFKNHYYFEFPKVGHGAVFPPCGEEIMLQFIDDPLSKPDQSCLTDLGENTIDFRTDYYRNSKLSTLSSGLRNGNNLTLIIGLAFIIVISLMNIIKGIIRQFSRIKSQSKPVHSVNSFLILLFIGGLIYFIFSTISEDYILLLFGLISSANYIFFLIPIIILLTLVAVFNTFKLKSYKIWNILVILSFIDFIAISITYHLYPNLM